MATSLPPEASQASRTPGYVALLLAVVLAYLPVWHALYFWDDLVYIVSNPSFSDLRGLLSFWTSRNADISPLTFTTFWIENALWGRAALPYHLTDVLLHAACAMVLWRVLRELDIPGAWIGAALWALHPVMVESAAWISETKNTQSGLFYLLAILFFLKALNARGKVELSRLPPEIIWTTLFAALAMASKSSTVILPLVLCLCAWWQEGRWRLGSILLTVPVLLLSALDSLLALWTQGIYVAAQSDPQWTRTFPQRIAGAGDAVWFYLGKLAWPQPLMIGYPRWHIDAAQWTSYLPVLAVLLLFGIFWYWRETWARPWFFAFTYFLIALLPALGLFDNFIFVYSLVFDHFQYLASMGPLALLGAGIAHLGALTGPYRRPLTIGLTAPLLAMLATLTWQRADVFQSDSKIWIDTLTKNPRCWFAYGNLGVAALYNVQNDYALKLFQTALRINPNFDTAETGIGNAYTAKGDMDQALVHFRRAVEINPNSGSGHTDIAKILLQKGDVDSAVVEYGKAVDIEPDNPETRCNLAGALVKAGRIDLAVLQIEAALEIDPNCAPAYFCLGAIAIQQHNFGAALATLLRSVELDPNKAESRNTLGWLLQQKRDWQDSIQQCRAAIQIQPDFAEAHNNLAIALAHSGQFAASVEQFQEVVRLKPGDPAALDNLTRAQALLRSPPVKE